MPLVEEFKNLKLREAYLKYVKAGTDISDHLPTLFSIAQLCDHVTEFGVRTGVSTVALLAGLEASEKPGIAKLVSYDKDACREARDYMLPLYAHNIMRGMTDDWTPRAIDWEFIQADTTAIGTIPQTDFLFIDSKHTAEQVYTELKKHACAVRKYLGFHDTVSCAEIDPGQLGNPLGLLWGIHRYLHEHPHEWALMHESLDNNGCRIYRRI